MAKQKDNIIKNALILFCITVLAGMLLGLTYEVTKEPIAKVQEDLKNAALQAVVNEADKFNALDLESTDALPGIEGVYEALKGDEVVGYAFEMTATEAYGGDISLMVGIGTDNIVLGIDVVKHSETPGLGAKADEDEFKSEFAGEEAKLLEVVKFTPSDDAGDISSISGATITSKSVTNAVNVAIEFYDAYISEVD